MIKHYDINELIYFIKPEYKEAASLILVDYCTLFLSRPSIRTSCEPIIRMTEKYPHTMEYVDWLKINQLSTTLLKSLAGGYSRPFEITDYMKTLKAHLDIHYYGIFKEAAR